MRLSILPTDPGYRADAGFYDVFFKGLLVRNAITADEEGREVTLIVLDDRGKPVRHPDSPTQVLTERKTGEVAIRRRVMRAS